MKHVYQKNKTKIYDSGEFAVMNVFDKLDEKDIFVCENQIADELYSNLVQPLLVFYITNRPEIALIAEKYGVDRIWIDLETMGKEDRQKDMNTVKSHHAVEDIEVIKPLLSRSEMLVRINQWHDESPSEIESVIAAGADIIMLPYWKTVEEVRQFVNVVNGRCKTTLLLETKEAVNCIDQVLDRGGFDEIHIGLNDLHLSYGMAFMFELLADGTVEKLCRKFKMAGIPYGFGGIARLGEGLLPAEKIIMEHYRLGSTRAILSRTFCDTTKMESMEEIDRMFRENMDSLRKYEMSMADVTQEEYIKNKGEISEAVEKIAAAIKGTGSNDVYIGRQIMPKALNAELLNKLIDRYGDSFYLLDSDVFEENCRKLMTAFRYYYPKTNIAYSYKTNYIPRLVQIVDRLDGLAEVVSEMEMEVALRSGVSADHIIWNGPVKNEKMVKELLLSGGTVNIDSIYEIDNILRIAKSHPEYRLNVGIRCNYDVGDGVLSRFGFDVDSKDFEKVLILIASAPNIHLISLQAHFAKRFPEFWTARAEGMIKAYKKAAEYGLRAERLDIGGGIYGEMPDVLREQMQVGKYGFDDYASRAAKTFAETFGADGPWLFIEPGTAVAANCMRYVCRIETIKTVRGKIIATTNGSQKNIGMSGLNPPMELIAGSEERKEYKDVDIAGYTCIESDFLYRSYNGKLGVGDYLILACCGSYSIVMKPPFILPNAAVIDISKDEVELIKREETFDDLFHTFSF